MYTGEYTGEVRKKSEVEIIFYSCENLTLGEHLFSGRYLKHEIGYTQFFIKSRIVIMHSTLQNDFPEFKWNFFF